MIRRQPFSFGFCSSKMWLFFSCATNFHHHHHHRHQQQQLCVATDTRSWGAQMAAHAKQGDEERVVKMYESMRRSGAQPDEHIFITVLKACARKSALIQGRQIHAHILEAGYDSNIYVASSLLHMYAKCGSLKEAEGVFGSLPQRDVVSWNAILAGYADHCLPRHSIDLFSRMQQEGVNPNTITCISLLKSCSHVKHLDEGRFVHSQIMKLGFGSDVVVANALMNMYSKCDALDEAMGVFENLTKKDVVSWNTIISGHVQQGQALEALCIFERMEKEGFFPDSITFVSILKACGCLMAIDKGKKIHVKARRFGLESNVFVGSILVDMYARFGDLSQAHRVFDRLRKKNVVAWNAMISGYANHGLGHHALELFKELQSKGIKPNDITFGSILKACGGIAAIEQGKWIHSQILEQGLESDMHVGSALVDMYAKCGSLDKAREVFDRLPGRDIVTWSALIAGYAQHGLGQQALQLFETMQQEGIKPNDITFVSVLSACSHANLFDSGFMIFGSMSKEVGITPKMEHYTCVIDLLGRAGNLEEAEDIILEMPMEADAAVWMSMLRACRTCNNVELGRFSFESLLKLEPTNAAAHVLMSNIYASAGMWKEKTDIRKKMLTAGVVKATPGCTWIEFNNHIHTFLVQDRLHPQRREIYEMANALKETIKVKLGYEPDLSCVLEDMPDIKKEELLWAHSEKLALAFGLINIPAGVPIRLVKNLRICRDCHTATKMISKITGREVIERDAKRFHHFKDGVCSCGDYW